jgi:hypothetical protein
MDKVRRILLWGLAAIALVALGGGGYWALTCPCDGTPGFALRGELHEDAAWRARITKLQDPGVQAMQPPGSTTPPLDAERPESWWSFRVETPPAD